MRIDLIRRILFRMFNVDVVMVMGITDIDSKIINRSKEVGKTVMVDYLIKFELLH